MCNNKAVAVKVFKSQLFQVCINISVVMSTAIDFDQSGHDKIVEDPVKVCRAFFFVAFGTTKYALSSHSRSLESFGLGTLFPDNQNCGLFKVFLFRLTSNMKTFASYLFRHLHPEISPICHETTCVIGNKLLHLLVPLPFRHIHCPYNLIVSDSGHCTWLEEFA